MCDDQKRWGERERFTCIANQYMNPVCDLFYLLNCGLDILNIPQIAFDKLGWDIILQ